MGINYGCDRIRFAAAVRVGSRLRARAEILEVQDVPDAVQIKARVKLEIDVVDKPACVVDSLSRYYF